MRDRDEVTELALATTLGDRVALSEFIRKTQADVCFVSRLSRPSVGDGLTQEILRGSCRRYLRSRGAQVLCIARACDGRELRPEELASGSASAEEERRQKGRRQAVRLPNGLGCLGSDCQCGSGSACQHPQQSSQTASS